MTKIEALEKTIEMWQYIADNNCSKLEYFSVKHLQPVHNECYLCEYIFGTFLQGNPCVYCPITWIPGESNDYFSCCVGDTIYALWCYSSNSEEKKKYALELVDLAKQALLKDMTNA